MEFSIDIDLLITLIEKRPVLWDKTRENYKNKQSNFSAWKEICLILKDDFETLPDKEKNDFGKLVIKKWNNARDNWIRCEKKLKEYKSGSATKPVQKYKFYDQMQFLNKIASHRPTSTNMPSGEDLEESPTVARLDSKVSKKRKKKDVIENEELSKKIANLEDSVEKNDNSRIMSFFRGIAPTIEKFSDADTVEFQYEVIKAMRNISQRTLTPHNVHHTRNCYQASTMATYTPQNVRNINKNLYEEYRILASSPSINFILNEHETLNAGRKTSNTDDSPDSIKTEKS